MSFILDALRKAEDKNRNRHTMTVPQGPRVLDDALPEAQPAERNSAVVLILAGAVIASALWWFMRDTSPQAPVSVVSPSPVQRAPAAQPASPVAQTGGPLPAERLNMRRETGARALDQEARRGDTPRRVQTASAPANNPSQATASAGRANATLSGGPQTVKPGTVTILDADGSLPQSASTVAPAVNPESAPTSRVQEETLPEYRAALTSGEVPMPQLHLDIHVYSTEPKKRFVFINLDKYGEGDSIDKETTVESIEPKGAVINHKGYRFVLQPD